MKHIFVTSYIILLNSEPITFFREDDNDRSDDDEDDEPSRMKFTINTGAVERQKIRETFLSLQEGK